MPTIQHFMAKQTIEEQRAFWKREIHLWKTTPGITWATWCKSRELDPKQMPRPLDEPPQKKLVEDRTRALMRSGKFAQSP